MDRLFQLIAEKNKGMGSISLWQDGQEVYQKTIGFASIAEQVKANSTTKYRVGSISKTFTASIIMQLVEEGKLTLQTRLSNYFSDVPNAADITIEQLLRHSSGIFNITNTATYTSWMEEPQSRDDMLAKIVQLEPAFSPGEKSEYSNSNYMLLTFIAEEIEQKSFREILASRITGPFSLTNTEYGGKIAVEKNEALSYNKIDQWELATETDMSVPLGAGAIISTPTDLNRFFFHLFSGEVVSIESLELMADLKDGYGLGLFQAPFHDKKALGHTGSIDGFGSVALYFREDNMSIAYTSNARDMVPNDILIGALSIYFGKNYDLPTFEVLYEIKDTAELDPYLGVYSSSTFPLKITITKQGKRLIAQATGQPSFPLEPYAEHKFKFDRAGLKMTFRPEKQEMVFTQGGGQWTMGRE